MDHTNLYPQSSGRDTSFSDSATGPSHQSPPQGAVIYSPFDENGKIRTQGLPSLLHLIRNSEQNLHPLNTTFSVHGQETTEVLPLQSNQGTPSPGLSSGTEIPGQYIASNAWSHDKPYSDLPPESIHSDDLHRQERTSDWTDPQAPRLLFHPSVRHTAIDSLDYQPFYYSNPNAPIGRQYMNPFHHTPQGGASHLTVDLEVDSGQTGSVSPQPQIMSYRRADGSQAYFQVSDEDDHLRANETMEGLEEDEWYNASQTWASRRT
ncbi:hypothetical protein TREMEDRAFT_60785 [Tremella mesenterica DSM 1558]|uniref:uncharacterized protein n=1 Tax=Tremella mesenterica (strain ATCC 24925 / CBS 8224 / DSM 1558 / NBRC 9311 / NRRL Y-6157 / RJB 2259-6 / UBC 559-6) TaxID=578456 RepID=UPI0003F4A14A|nr:uncharacterized protein TREMEDRAFT_60785 [Tremella mesenterica DSM 1558]EIW71862.1 hypothetical protein TREMEDRAFT_60785 [Tremella mesenterica DSM 1558]